MSRLGLQILALILIVTGLSAFTGHDAQSQNDARALPSGQQQLLLSYSSVVKTISPAVVNIYTSRVVTKTYSPFGNDPFFNQFFGRSFGGQTRQQMENSLGSGVIVGDDGIVITNAHVIKGADEISVVLHDGREFAAELSLLDEASDLAVLRVDSDGEKLPYAEMRPSETLEVGDIVLAIGNPFGVGQTVTSGIVSALARSSMNVNDYNFFIQTDAAINPGNSGGPLVSMDGKIVGINTAIYSRSGGSLGIGFAIPSEMVNTVIAAEKAGNKGEKGVIRPWIGVNAQEITPDIAYSLELNRPQGVLIADLHPESPARKAGMKTGDVVTAVNGRIVRNPPEMRFRLATVPLGDTADIEYLRKGKKGTVTIKAMAPPDSPARNETVLEGAHPLNGVRVANLNPAVSYELGLHGDDIGVVVMDTNPRSRFRVARKGDLIVAINGEEIADVDTLTKSLKAGEGKGWAFVIERDGQKRQIVIR